jgi:hypothetical protein
MQLMRSWPSMHAAVKDLPPALKSVSTLAGGILHQLSAEHLAMIWDTGRCAMAVVVVMPAALLDVSQRYSTKLMQLPLYCLTAWNLFVYVNVHGMVWRCVICGDACLLMQ